MQNRSFFGSLPPITKNLIIINFLLWFATITLPRVGVDLVDLLGLHYFQSSKFNACSWSLICLCMTLIPFPMCFSICSLCLCSGVRWRLHGAVNVFYSTILRPVLVLVWYRKFFGMYCCMTRLRWLLQI